MAEAPRPLLDAGFDSIQDYERHRWLRDFAGTPLAKWLRKVKAFRVKDFGMSSEDPSYIDREETALEDAQVVSSLHRSSRAGSPTARHDLVLDIDHPLHIVDSSTPGHYHLIVEVPFGISNAVYMKLLDALADAGVIERGYADVSKARGHSDIRVPWLKKDMTP